MKITEKSLNFMQDHYYELDEIINKMFKGQSDAGLLSTRKFNTIKSWAFYHSEICITYSDGNDEECEMYISFEDICNSEKIIEEYAEQGRIKFDLECKAAAQKKLNTENAKLEFERCEFERLRQKFEGK